MTKIRSSLLVYLFYLTSLAFSYCGWCWRALTLLWPLSLPFIFSVCFFDVISSSFFFFASCRKPLRRWHFCFLQSLLMYLVHVLRFFYTNQRNVIVCAILVTAVIEFVPANLSCVIGLDQRVHRFIRLDVISSCARTPSWPPPSKPLSYQYTYAFGTITPCVDNLINRRFHVCAGLVAVIRCEHVYSVINLHLLSKMLWCLVSVWSNIHRQIVLHVRRRSFISFNYT